MELLQLDSELRLIAREPICYKPPDDKDCRKGVLSVRETDTVGPYRYLLNANFKDFHCCGSNPWSVNLKHRLEPAGAVQSVVLGRHAHCSIFDSSCHNLPDEDLIRSP